MTTTTAWRNKGRENCKSDVRHEKKPDGSVVVTCSKCALDYTIWSTR
jgi:hypothetical protein